ncbi:restriction endonuclease subunit S [Enterococcus gallinarum]|uniref:restriction endonuclease subunit S n=1 Tax=Enterococcus gallinarum TaxID=1353 RepID=UPI002DB5AD50|nr:restriction endonuclease subunit S [Enterococcus gallinarum]MEB5970270.1 restriction endonuclease subunit S [Enterococcus gallinarum]
MSNDTQPEIRFPGFTEAWEQRKLSNMTQYKNGKGHEDRQVESGKLELVNLNSISIDGGLKYSGKFVDEADETLMKDDLVMILSDVGHGDLLGRVALIPEDNRFVLNQRVALLRTNETANPKFLFSYINAHQYYFKSQGAGMSQLNISKGSVENFIGFVPLLSEQKQIGNFFKQLDDIIALQQRKLDLLKETKKGFLQKMFPKNGAKVPEIRFPGFTEDWEERRLQEVVDRYDNLRIPITASKRVAGNTPYYGANGIQGYVEGYTHDGEFILVAEDGANDLKNYPVQYVDGKVWVNNHAHVIQAKENLADNMFLMNAIRSINIEPFLVGGGRAKLNADVLMKLEVIIPLKSEQQKIGTFFKQLDDTIALHQRKLDLLKETKKGFLQKMFV